MMLKLLLLLSSIISAITADALNEASLQQQVTVQRRISRRPMNEDLQMQQKLREQQKKPDPATIVIEDEERDDDDDDDEEDEQEDDDYYGDDEELDNSFGFESGSQYPNYYYEYEDDEYDDEDEAEEPEEADDVNINAPETPEAQDVETPEAQDVEAPEAQSDNQSQEEEQPQQPDGISLAALDEAFEAGKASLLQELLVQMEPSAEENMVMSESQEIDALINEVMEDIATEALNAESVSAGSESEKDGQDLGQEPVANLEATDKSEAIDNLEAINSLEVEDTPEAETAELATLESQELQDHAALATPSNETASSGRKHRRSSRHSSSRRSNNAASKNRSSGSSRRSSHRRSTGSNQAALAQPAESNVAKAGDVPRNELKRGHRRKHGRNAHSNQEKRINGLEDKSASASTNQGHRQKRHRRQKPSSHSNAEIKQKTK